MRIHSRNVVHTFVWSYFPLFCADMGDYNFTGTPASLEGSLKGCRSRAWSRRARGISQEGCWGQGHDSTWD